jgi:lipopolysaccharide export system protein LptC
MPGQQQRVKDMTTHHSTITKFTTPLSEIFASISRTTIQHFEAKAQRARLAYDIKTLTAFDPYLLNDIGMQGFKQLSPAQQERAIIDRIKHASRI